MIKLSLILENIKISFKSISSSLLRSILTVFIIAIGIMALTGILTAVESIKQTITTEFHRMGSNTFSITQQHVRQMDRGSFRRSVPNTIISFDEASRFKRDYNFPALVSRSIRVTSTGKVAYLNRITDPNVTIFGADENYLATSGSDIEIGRNFTESEIISGENIVIIGSELYETLFSSNENPIGKYVSIRNTRYRVVGLLNEKGSSFGGSEDRVCIIPINNARQNLINRAGSYTISVQALNPAMIDMALGEAEGIFRNIRCLTVYDNNNFRIIRSESLITAMLDNIKVVTFGATIIGIITLLGASIGLMNIMLVSVNERTREIGTRKALGAKSSAIKQQFLFEALIIGQIGGFFGVILGIIAGNIVGLITGGAFIIPWNWILLSVFLCFLVGILSGYLPAVKASKLEPVVALRHE